jgi:hypothetical protein
LVTACIGTAPSPQRKKHFIEGKIEGRIEVTEDEEGE